MTNDTFDQEVVEPALSNRGHAYLSLIMAYDCIGRWATIR
jgi:hypothetical protein